MISPALNAFFGNTNSFFTTSSALFSSSFNRVFSVLTLFSFFSLLFSVQLWAQPNANQKVNRLSLKINNNTNQQVNRLSLNNNTNQKVNGLSLTINNNEKANTKSTSNTINANTINANTINTTPTGGLDFTTYTPSGKQHKASAPNGEIFIQNVNALIVDTEKGDTISLLEWAERLYAADVVFFGEQHDDSITHLLQFQLFEALHQLKNKKVILSVEMFETDRQTVLNEYLRGFITEAQFQKDAAIWNNYKDYRPLVELAKKENIEVVAANTPRRYVNLVSRKGMKILDSLSKESKSFLPPLPYDTLGGAYRDKFFGLMGGHGVGGPSNIYYSQNLWDATMSWNIFKTKRLKQNKNALVYHLCGRFHSDEQLGTVAQLRKRAPNWTIKTISALPPAMHGEAFNEKDKKPIADFIVYIAQ